MLAGLNSDEPVPETMASPDETNSRLYTCKLLATGASFLLPFGVAIVGVLLTALGIELSDTLVRGLFAFGFVGIAITIVGVTLTLPRSWAIWIRVATALILTTPLCLIAIYLAFIMFVVGYVTVGGRWIPA